MPTEKELIEKLLSQRSSFINIKSKVYEVVEPNIFRLLTENIENVRNLMIVAGAFLTFSTLVFAKNDYLFQENQFLIRLSILCNLFTVLLYSFYLKNEIQNGINSYKKVLKKNSDVANEGQNIINECLDGKIAFDDAQKKLGEVYKKIEFEILRPKDNEGIEDRVSRVGQFGNFFFVASTILLVIGLVNLPLADYWDILLYNLTFIFGHYPAIL